MVEKHKLNRDKIKSQREKKIKRVDDHKQEKQFKRDMRDLAQGKVDPEDFDEEYGGKT